MTSETIMIVDDDADLLSLLSMRLSGAGYEICQASCAEEALAKLPVARPGLIVTDLRMGEMDGLSLFENIRNMDSLLPVIIMTAHGSIPDAVEATQKGVFSFLTKPVDGKNLIKEVKRALSLSGSSGDSGHDDSREWRRCLISQSQIMEDLLAQAKLVAGGRSNIMIHGESGTGKELLAKAIHAASPRRDKPFIAVNCGAIPETLLESELFGHVKGSFTGAVRNHLGLVRAADGGTLFLDEIGDTPLSFQVKLLRVIQERNLRPVGSTETIEVDVRIISATHQSLRELMDNGQFREDLFYRLNVVTLELPPLKDRPEDIPLLANYFLQTLAKEANKKVNSFAPEAMELLMAEGWPGNVRQLYNVVEHSVAIATSSIISQDLLKVTIQKGFSTFPTYAEAKQRFEQDYLITLLKMTEGNVTQAARISKRNRTDFYKLLQRNHIVSALFKKS
nr:sigma 54-interacting transcriptional regulator [Desulfobulbaceae bacterium]